MSQETVKLVNRSDTPEYRYTLEVLHNNPPQKSIRERILTLTAAPEATYEQITREFLDLRDKWCPPCDAQPKGWKPENPPMETMWAEDDLVKVHMTYNGFKKLVEGHFLCFKMSYERLVIRIAKEMCALRDMQTHNSKAYENLGQMESNLNLEDFIPD